MGGGGGGRVEREEKGGPHKHPGPLAFGCTSALSAELGWIRVGKWCRRSNALRGVGGGGMEVWVPRS